MIQVYRLHLCVYIEMIFTFTSTLIYKIIRQFKKMHTNCWNSYPITLFPHDSSHVQQWKKEVQDSLYPTTQTQRFITCSIHYIPPHKPNNSSHVRQWKKEVQDSLYPTIQTPRFITCSIVEKGGIGFLYPTTKNPHDSSYVRQWKKEVQDSLYPTTQTPHDSSHVSQLKKELQDSYPTTLHHMIHHNV